MFWSYYPLSENYFVCTLKSSPNKKDLKYVTVAPFSVFFCWKQNWTKSDKGVAKPSLLGGSLSKIEHPIILVFSQKNHSFFSQILFSQYFFIIFFSGTNLPQYAPIKYWNQTFIALAVAIETFAGRIFLPKMWCVMYRDTRVCRTAIFLSNSLISKNSYVCALMPNPSAKGRSN